MKIDMDVMEFYDYCYYASVDSLFVSCYLGVEVWVKYYVESTIENASTYTWFDGELEWLIKKSYRVWEWTIQ